MNFVSSITFGELMRNDIICLTTGTGLAISGMLIKFCNDNVEEEESGWSSRFHLDSLGLTPAWGNLPKNNHPMCLKNDHELQSESQKCLKKTYLANKILFWKAKKCLGGQVG